MPLTFKNLQDIVIDMIEVDDTQTRTRVKQYINMAGRDVWYRYPWHEREKTVFHSTVAPYETGTASVTQDTTSVTGSGTTWTSAMTGRKFASSLIDQHYTFTFSSTTALTLDRNYVGDSLSGDTYIIYQDVVRYSDEVETIQNLMVGDPRRGGVSQQVARVDLDGLAYFPRSTGTPTKYALLEPGSANTLAIRLWPVPDDEYSLQTTYLARWTDLVGDNEPMPFEDSKTDLIVLGALRWAYMMAFQSSKAEQARSRFEAELLRTWGHTRQRHPQHMTLRKFDDWQRWRNTVKLPVVEP